ncbi:hypothetical protein [Rhodocaloribacter sp.]
MGQQQLLLLVIGIIIVAIAVMAGLYAVQTKFKQSIADNLVDRNLSIATDAVFWKTKRDPFNGGNAQYSGLETDGMQTLFLGEETKQGMFKITLATANRLEITAVSLRYPEIGVRTYVTDYSIDSTVISYDSTITF